MNRYLLDTNHASAIVRRQNRMAERVRQTEDSQFSVGIPTVGELWFMIYNSGRPKENAAELEDVLADLIVWPFDDPPAREFGRIKTELRRSGSPIPAVDAQIAAIARVRELILLTADRHFSAVQELGIENWLM